MYSLVSERIGIFSENYLLDVTIPKCPKCPKWTFVEIYCISFVGIFSEPITGDLLSLRKYACYDIELSSDLLLIPYGYCALNMNVN